MSLFVVGTDTDAGKTAVSSFLLKSSGPASPLRYWKPIQSGSPPDDDTRMVQEYCEFPDHRFCDPVYRFKEPLSPHRAAEIEGETVALEVLIGAYHTLGGPLLVEGAGGLMVPLNRYSTWCDFLRETKLPVLIVARTGLGTINHSLLTVEQLYRLEIPLAGLFFFGNSDGAGEDNIRTIADFSGLPVIGKIEMNPGKGPVGSIQRPELLEPFFQEGKV